MEIGSGFATTVKYIIAENFSAEGEERANAGRQLKSLSDGQAAMVEKFKVNELEY